MGGTSGNELIDLSLTYEVWYCDYMSMCVDRTAGCSYTGFVWNRSRAHVHSHTLCTIVHRWILAVISGKSLTRHALFSGLCASCIICALCHMCTGVGNLIGTGKEAIAPPPPLQGKWKGFPSFFDWKCVTWHPRYSALHLISHNIQHEFQLSFIHMQGSHLLMNTSGSQNLCFCFETESERNQKLQIKPFQCLAWKGLNLFMQDVKIIEWMLCSACGKQHQWHFW